MNKTFIWKFETNVAIAVAHDVDQAREMLKKQNQINLDTYRVLDSALSDIELNSPKNELELSKEWKEFESFVSRNFFLSNEEFLTILFEEPHYVLDFNENKSIIF